MMNHTGVDAILLLRDTYQDTYFTEKELHIITAAFLIVGAILNVLLIFLSINRVRQGNFFESH